MVVKPREQWSYAGDPYLSGEIESTRLDVAALGLAPLRLEDQGIWNPDEEYWGEARERRVGQADHRARSAARIRDGAKILMNLCEADLRCLDAHAHLGNFVFDTGLPKPFATTRWDFASASCR